MRNLDKIQDLYHTFHFLAGIRPFLAFFWEIWQNVFSFFADFNHFFSSFSSPPFSQNFWDAKFYKNLLWIARFWQNIKCVQSRANKVLKTGFDTINDLPALCDGVRTARRYWRIPSSSFEVEAIPPCPSASPPEVRDIASTSQDSEDIFQYLLAMLMPLSQSQLNFWSVLR